MAPRTASQRLLRQRHSQKQRVDRRASKSFEGAVLHRNWCFQKWTSEALAQIWTCALDRPIAAWMRMMAKSKNQLYPVRTFSFPAAGRWNYIYASLNWKPSFEETLPKTSVGFLQNVASPCVHDGSWWLFLTLQCFRIHVSTIAKHLIISPPWRNLRRNWGRDWKPKLLVMSWTVLKAWRKGFKTTVVWFLAHSNQSSPHWRWPIRDLGKYRFWKSSKRSTYEKLHMPLQSHPCQWWN